jgi:lysophospholipase L1-like esterase
MNTKTKLLTIGIALMIISLCVAAAVLIQTNGNSKSPASPIRVACIGDSITEGSEYPGDLWMLLGSNYTVGNFGFGGTAVSLDSETPYMKEPVFQDAKDFQPNIVVIMLGANDAYPYLKQDNASFIEDYIKLIASFQTLASKPQIWIVKPPPVFHNGTGLSTPYFEANVIPSIEQVSNKTNLPTIDVYSTLANHSDYFPDGVHPNSEGSKLIAEEVYKAIISK